MLKQNFDSLDFLKLIFFLEKKYKIQINSKKFSNLQKITALVKHMEKNIEQRTALMFKKNVLWRSYNF